MSYDAMKNQFTRIFPEYAGKLVSATSQDHVLELQRQFIAEHREKLRLALQGASSTQSGVLLAASNDRIDQSDPIYLNAAKFEKLIHARNGEIQTQVQLLLDGLERTQKMGDKANPEEVTAQLIGFGALAIGSIAGAVVFSALSGAILTEALTISASLAGVIAVTAAAVVAIAAIVIGLIFFPLFYFMVKPAVCIMFLTNELDEDLTFRDEFNVHGKPTLLTTVIPKALIFPSGTIIAYGGLFSTAKKDDGLFGTQFGFVMNYRGSALTFATECPLNGVNNCYCSFDDSAESAARATAQRKEQYFETSKNGIKLSIRCNSSSGSVAWYIARAYRG